MKTLIIVQKYGKVYRAVSVDFPGIQCYGETGEDAVKGIKKEIKEEIEHIENFQTISEDDLAPSFPLWVSMDIDKKESIQI